MHIDPKDFAPKEESGDEDGTASIDPIGYDGDGQDIVKDESFMDRMKRIAGEALSMKLGDVELKEGGAPTPGMITVDPAQLAAEFMNKKIQDQLTESGMAQEFRKFLFEMTMLGSGCLKGPFYTEKEYPKWDEEGNYVPIFKPVPVSKFVSIWNLYPDENATSIKNADWMIERHKMNNRELKDLKSQPYFRATAIAEAIEGGANYHNEDWEQRIQEGRTRSTSERFEVLEYWGTMPVELLKEYDDFDFPKDVDDDDELEVNAWVCNGIIIRLVLNPFKPSRIPYHVCPYEEDPYNFFGIGLPENMEDSQTLMNGFTRMAVDNAVLAGNVMLDIDMDSLEVGQDLSIYSGKVWKRNGGQPGGSVNAITFPNTANSNMMMYDKFRQLADESTGVSSFSHGQTGVSGVGRTAAGISMLMNAASTAIKTVIKNVDDYALEPMGKAYFAWNMQFDFSDILIGDLEVKPLGVASMMQKEVKSQKLMQLVQTVASDPEMSARINKEYVLKEIVKSMEIDPDKAVLSPELAELKMAMMGEQPGAQPQQGDQMGGNIGVNPTPPLPGEQGFTANGGTPPAPEAQPLPEVPQGVMPNER